MLPGQPADKTKFETKQIGSDLETAEPGLTHEWKTNHESGNTNNINISALYLARC